MIGRRRGKGFWVLWAAAAITFAGCSMTTEQKDYTIYGAVAGAAVGLSVIGVGWARAIGKAHEEPGITSPCPGTVLSVRTATVPPSPPPVSMCLNSM